MLDSDKEKRARLFNPGEEVRGEALVLVDHSLDVHLLAQDLHTIYLFVTLEYLS
jgi:hypothetical protein